MIKKIFSAAAVLTLLFVFASLPPAVSDCSVTGTYTSAWGPVTLQQDGNVVHGTWQEGTVDGNIQNGEIHYIWYRYNVPSGRGYWQISPDCYRLTGPWGNGESETGGGNWDLTRQRERFGQ